MMGDGQQHDEELVSWCEVLCECRKIQDKLVNHREDAGACWADSFGICKAYFGALTRQVTAYVDHLDSLQLGVQTETRTKEFAQKLVMDTRSALRFGMACFAIENKKFRDAVQEEMVCKHHIHEACLYRVLVHTRGDDKCRLLAARLWSNLVTSNKASADVIISWMDVAPSSEAISSLIYECAVQTTNQSTLERHGVNPNWVDLLLATSRCKSRDVLAAVVASLHNCIVSMEEYSDHMLTTSHARSNEGTGVAYSGCIAKNNLLVSTILRQFISVHAVLSDAVPTTDESSTLRNPAPRDSMDSATEWIDILLRKLCQMGHFAHLYAASGGANSLKGQVFPEQLVLLQWLSHDVQVLESGNTSHSSTLGGSCDDRIVASQIFLVNLFSEIRKRCIENTAREDDDTAVLGKSALLSVAETIAETLGTDTMAATLVRNNVGKETLFLKEIAEDLNRLYDAVSARKAKVASSRDLTMSSEEQRCMTSLMRVLGNLVFKCKHNQDLLRTTMLSADSSSHQTSRATAADEQTTARSALHLLLSCTSFSYACFTLREWSVVAIRHALEDNEANQAAVAELEAQQPVQSTALNDMGIQVNLNQKGKVSVTPIDEAIAEEEEGGDGG